MDRPRCAEGKKWCVAPGRLIGRHFLWDVHRVAYVLQNLFTEQNPFELVHCRGTNTGWKRKDFEAPALVRDPALDARSLKLSLQGAGGSAVAPDTVRAVESFQLSVPERTVARGALTDPHSEPASRDSRWA